MNIVAIFLATFVCACSLASPVYLRPEVNDIVVLPGIDGTLYQFHPEDPLLANWWASYQYQRYPTTNHRSKRQTDVGVSASLTIPLGGGSSKPSWDVGGFITRSDNNLNLRVDAGLRGNFGDTPSWSMSGQLERTGTNSNFIGKGEIGGQLGNTPDWSLSGQLERTGTNSHFIGKGEIGGQLGNTPDRSLGGVFSRRDGDWTGRLGGGLNSQGGSTFGVGLERGGLGGHIDVTNGRVTVGPGSVPNTESSLN